MESKKLELVESKSEGRRAHLEDVLKTFYEVKGQLIDSLSTQELEELLSLKQAKHVKQKKNLNSFWAVKSLPPPELPAATGPKRHGFYIALGFFFAITLMADVITAGILVAGKT